MAEPVEDDLVEQVRKEAAKTGRKPLEILESMRDEGYIRCDDDALKYVAELAAAAGQRSAHKEG